jgi:oxygen-independent coproporphyrinogen-3 oxidase
MSHDGDLGVATRPTDSRAAGNLWEPVPFDRSKILRYDRPGPRYTSYPAAPHFRDDFRGARYRELLESSAGTGVPLSLYVHIPFCSKRCFFCGCHVKIARDHTRGKTYLPLIEREMEHAAEACGAAEREVVQVHWGGGTPTFLPPEDLSALAAMSRRHFPLAESCEIGLEVDPRQCTDEHLDALQEAGFNRISMGVQDLDPRVQEAMNRIQPLEMSRSLVEGARRRGMTSVNVDLIYGLPLQTPESFARTLDQVVEVLDPDRLAIFNFAYLPAMLPHQRVINPKAVPGPEEKLALLETAVEKLTEAGYIFIGMDHFAKPEDPLSQALKDGSLTRNFQGYSTCGATDLLAFGVSAISQVAGGYAQNEKEIPDYRRRLEGEDGSPEGDANDAAGFATARGLELDAEDELRRDVIMTLMCTFRLHKSAIEERHGIDFDAHFGDALEALAPMADDGLLEIDADRLEVLPLGRLLIRNLAMTFDAYLPRETRVRYSRTV